MFNFRSWFNIIHGFNNLKNLKPIIENTNKKIITPRCKNSINYHKLASKTYYIIIPLKYEFITEISMDNIENSEAFIQETH